MNQLFYPLIGVFVYLTILVAIAEGLSRLVTDDPELTRKVVHIGSGNVILLAWLFGIEQSVIVSAAVIAGIIALVSYMTPILPSINSIGRKSLGTFFYAVSIGVLAGIFWQNFPQYTTIGILVMAWGDGMAAIVGQRLGKHKYQILGIEKSWEGSGAMAIASFVVTLLVLLGIQGNSTETWLTGLLVAAIATGLEAFSKFGLDNLTVPIVSGLICYGCYQMI